MKSALPRAFLVALAGIGWACAFAAIGLGLFAGQSDIAPIALVFAAFGFVGGAASTALRLAFEQRLPLELTAQLRGHGVEDDGAESTTATVSHSASAFGA